jgi:hypothetical protein
MTPYESVTMMHVLVKGRLDQSLLGTRAALPVFVRWRIQKGKDVRRRTLMARRVIVFAERMLVRSALRMLGSC